MRTVRRRLACRTKRNCRQSPGCCRSRPPRPSRRSAAKSKFNGWPNPGVVPVAPRSTGLPVPATLEMNFRTFASEFVMNWSSIQISAKDPPNATPPPGFAPKHSVVAQLIVSSMYVVTVSVRLMPLIRHQRFAAFAISTDHMRCAIVSTANRLPGVDRRRISGSALPDQQGLQHPTIWSASSRRPASCRRGSWCRRSRPA